MLGGLGGRNSCPGPTVLSPAPAHRGLFKTDRVLGTAQLKLDALESTCEVREILEVRCGPLATGSGVWPCHWFNIIQKLPTGPGPPRGLFC